MTNDRNRLGTTFDEASSLYDEVRPVYPDDLFDDVVSLSGIRAGGRILALVQTPNRSSEFRTERR
jgi:hypothetical protein